MILDEDVTLVDCCMTITNCHVQCVSGSQTGNGTRVLARVVHVLGQPTLTQLYSWLNLATPGSGLGTSATAVDPWAMCHHWHAVHYLD